MRRPVARSLVLAAVIAVAIPLTWGTGGTAGAQEPTESLKDVHKAIEGVSKDLASAIASVLEKRHGDLARAVESLHQRSAARIADLERTVKERDARLVELEKRVAELTAQLAKAAPATPPAPPATPAPAKASNAFLGVGHMDDKDGARVTTIHPDTPAHAAGLRQDDVITHVNGKAVTSESLGDAIAQRKPGDVVTLGVLRAGNKSDAKATLVDRNEFFARRGASVEKQPGNVLLGVTVEDSAKGAMVYDVEEGFTGQIAGLKKGDYLRAVNSKPVKTVDEVAAAVAGLKAGEQFSLSVERGHETLELAIVGASGKGGARLVGQKVASPAAPAKEATPVRPAAKGPAFLGVAVSEEDDGLRVEEVLADSSAAAFGVQKGDLLTSVNGKGLKESEQLVALVKSLSAGDKINVVVRRGTSTVEIKDVVLGARGEKVSPPAATGKPDGVAGSAEAPKADTPKADAPKPVAPKPEKPKPRGILGIGARVTDDGDVVVSDVTSGGAADAAGVKAGDVLLKIGDKSVKSFDDLEVAMRGVFAGDALVLRVRRGSEEKEIKLTLSAAPSEETSSE